MSYTLLNYTEYDVWSLVNQIIKKLNETSSAWSDTYPSGVGQKMIEHLAYVANLVLYSVERRAEESYLDTAQLRSSIISLVKLLNYTPSRATSSTGTLTFTLAATHVEDVHIPKGTKCSSQEGYTFSTSEEKYISAGDLTVDVETIQGEYDEILVTSDGTEDQYTNIPFTNVENTSLEVYVDDVLWTKVSSLLNSVDTDQHYTITQESDDTVTVHFGNNITGKIPPLESIITFSFVKTDGAAGNVYEAARIITISDTIYDDVDDEVSDISVTNAGQFLGGGDSEETEHIRYYAPLLFATGQRAVTKEDYKALINSYAGVADSNVWGEFEEGDSPDFDMYNVVKICVALQNWQTADATFKTNLGTYLQDYAMLTVKYEYEDPYFVKSIIKIDLYCDSDADLAEVRSNVQAALEALFVPGSSVLLGEKKYLSDLHTTVNAIEKVQYSHIVLQIEEDMSYNGSLTRWERTIPVLPVKSGSVEVWARKTGENWTLIGRDTNFNHFENVVGSSYTITSGEIDYDTTGSSWLIVSPDDLNEVKLRYVQTDGDITVSKNQICKIQEIQFGTVQ
jgi:hypothetical protein